MAAKAKKKGGRAKAAAEPRRGKVPVPAGSRAPRVGYSARSRVEKLGVKPGMRVALAGVDDPWIRGELAGVPARVSEGAPRGPVDMVLLGAEGARDLARLPALRSRIAPAGCIWVVWPKGRREFREDDVRAAALAQRLVDVKVMAFSETLSGLKLVIPVAMR